MLILPQSKYKDYNMGMSLLRAIRFNGSGKAKKDNLIALSFDEGPNERNVLEILKILKEYKSQATLFWIVDYAKKLYQEKPDLFKMIIDQIKKEGHEVGLHAPYDYVPTLYSRLYGKFNKEELKIAIKELKNITNLPIKLFRPHYLLQPMSIMKARELGLTTVLGDIFHYSDAAFPVNFQIWRFSSANPGSILIFHDGVCMLRKKTYITQVLPIVLGNLRKKGLTPTKVSNVL